MTTAVLAQGVIKHFPRVHALQGVDLTIAHGEFFGLLGPNGAGKSTLINIMAGLTRADSGRMAIMGHDVVTGYRMARRNLGVVPQELVFDPFFTVRETLRIQSGYFGLGRENDAWIDELLAELKLADRADSNMRSLSGGMKRRVLIAQALVHRPPVLVLDEPTAGVDVELRKLLWGFIQRLHRQGHTIILTTHYLEEAESLCDRIAILNHGRIVALDTKQSLLNGDLGRGLRLRVVANADILAIPAILAAKVVKHAGNTLELALDKGADSIVAVLNELQRSGIEVVDLHTEQADLEDIFINLTSREAD
ncbi:MAG: ABC transporter ATP-binding protein [Gammaproteobacteria bacterium]|nr:ABC transporter ATP-binding protein [Gammaproteobacteria bacterium]